MNNKQTCDHMAVVLTLFYQGNTLTGQQVDVRWLEPYYIVNYMWNIPRFSHIEFCNSLYNYNMFNPANIIILIYRVHLELKYTRSIKQSKIPGVQIHNKD